MPVNHIWGARSVQGVNNQFGQDAQVYGTPTIKDSRMLMGRVFDTADIENCTISGDIMIFGSPILINTVVIGKSVVGGQACLNSCTVSDMALVYENAHLQNCHVVGNARIHGEADVRNAMIGGEAIIKGTAKIFGQEGGVLEIGGYVYLDRGIWNRAPLHFVCEASGLVVTESEGEQINVNCTTNTAKKWLNGAGRRYGKILGMTPAECDEALYYIELIAKETGKCY